MKTIHLTNGGVTLVDDGDFEDLSKFSWRLLKNDRGGYAVRATQLDGKDVVVLMHRQITDAEGGLDVDHRNHDGLDNQRHNLRVCTRSQNGQNSRSRRGSTSQYKGVCRWGDKWRATIKIGGKATHLGLYDSEEHAARIYDEAARLHFGDFACPNFADVAAAPSTRRTKTSQYRGVTLASKVAPRWRAYIRIDGQLTQLGYFSDESQAARAYDKAAIEAFGPKAKLNFSNAIDGGNRLRPGRAS